MRTLSFEQVKLHNKSGVKIKIIEDSIFFKISVGKNYEPIVLNCNLNDMLFAKQNSKFKHSTSKFEYVSEQEILKQLNVDPTLVNIIPNLYLQPSIIKRVQSRSNQNAFRLIKWKNSKLKGWGNCNSKVYYNKPVDQAELDRCNKNMEIAVQKAAKLNDLSFFALFLEAYKDSLKAQHKSAAISKSKEKKLIDLFNNKVDFIQKNK